METVEFKVPIPEGMEIDKKNSTFECIKFKPIKPKRWRDDKNAVMNGYYIVETRINAVANARNCAANHNIFATKKQVKSAFAMARISQIMANDKRFGGVVTDKEWNNSQIDKYCIGRLCDHIHTFCYSNTYCFLAFHTEGQRNLFWKENEDLIKDYLML